LDSSIFIHLELLSDRVKHVVPVNIGLLCQYTLRLFLLAGCDYVCRMHVQKRAYGHGACCSSWWHHWFGAGTATRGQNRQLGKIGNFQALELAKLGIAPLLEYQKSYTYPYSPSSYLSWWQSYTIETRTWKQLELYFQS
jgi:hypothetical protein